MKGALFAFKSPLSNGMILADEVWLGKTLDAGVYRKLQKEGIINLFNQKNSMIIIMLQGFKKSYLKTDMT